MPWPAKSRTTESPAPSTYCWPAARTPPGRLPGRARSIARYSASRVTTTSRCRRGSTWPTGTVTATSPWNPSTTAPRSSDTSAPSGSGIPSGMPCTTSSFTEMQMLAGNPRYPKNDGVPPRARRYRSAIAFNCVPVTPGRTARTTSRRASAASTPARRICSISTGVFKMTIAVRVAIAFRTGLCIGLPRARPRLDDLDQLAVHALNVAVAHRLKQPAATVEVDQRLRFSMIDFQTPPHRFVPVVFPLKQLAAVDVTPTRDPGRAQLRVIDVRGRPAHPPACQAADNHIIGDVKVQYQIDMASSRPQHPVQSASLSQGARKSVQHKAALCIRLVEPLVDDTDHHVVWDQLAPIHVQCGFLPKLGLRRHRRAQYIAGTDLWDAFALLEQLRLGPLARAWRPEKDKVHLPHESFIVAHQDVRFDLLHGLQGHAHHDQQRRAGQREVEDAAAAGHVGRHNRDARQHERANHRQPVYNTGQVLSGRPPGPDAGDEPPVLLNIL